jgi:DNA repair protein RadD
MADGEAGGTRLQLRGYQLEALERVKVSYRQGKRAICLVSPVGSGKTLLGSRFVLGAVEKKARQVWWLAHRDELAEQARARLLKEGAERVGIIAAGYPMTNAAIQVASIQTLAARAARGLATDLDLVVFDECHHLPADSWLEVVRALKPKLLIGLTATPERGDGRGLGLGNGGLFDDLIQVSSVRELQDLGYLVPCVTYASSPSKTLAQHPVAAYLARAPGERAFCFCGDVAHAETLALEFIAQGVPAATIHAETPKILRRARLEAFRRQDPQPLHEAGVLDPAPLVLLNVYTLTEGVDVPEATCCILARGCGHPGMMLQMVGRVLRPAEGKTRAVFIDLCGVTQLRNRRGELKIGMPEADREWSLEGRQAGSLAEQDRDADRKAKPCPKCGGMVLMWGVDAEGWRICPHCRERVAAPVKPPTDTPRELHQLGRGASIDAKTGALIGLARAAAKRGGNRVGWVAHRYMEKFGDWPARGAALRALRELGIEPTGPRREERDA